jgi:hypothetical protein
MSNPFRQDLLARPQAKPCTIVIFGATGDLTHRKLIPALYNLAGKWGQGANLGVNGVRVQILTKIPAKGTNPLPMPPPRCYQPHQP